MCKGICGVFKLLGNERTGILFAESFGFFNGALHTVFAGRQNNLCAVGGKELAAFNAHGVGHGQDQGISLDGSGDGKSDSGVAAGGFNDQGAGSKFTGFFSFFNHGNTHAVFDTAAGVEELYFCKNFS